MDNASVNGNPIPNTTVTVTEIPLPINVSTDESSTNNYDNGGIPLNGIVKGKPEPDLPYDEVMSVVNIYSL